MSSRRIVFTGKVENRRPLRLSAGRTLLLPLAALASVALAACGSSSSPAASTQTSTQATTATTAAAAPVTVRLGYFPNVTHGMALVGVKEGIFAKDLGSDTLDASHTFNAGPDEVQALLSGSIDIAFIGPAPAINAYVQSGGAVEIVSGAASGGAALVTKASITSVDQLKGTTLASPQLANTQDVALKSFLKSKGLTSTVTVQPSTSGNGTIVTEFEAGSIAGAWVPEPYLSEMVAAGGHVLVDEKTLWPGGKFATTTVIARTAFVKDHPATVTRFLNGLVDTLTAIKTDPAAAETAANAQLATLTGKALSASVLNAAANDLTFTVDPLVSTMQQEINNAVSVGLLKDPGSISGVYNLGPLNAVLAAKGQTPVPTS